MPVLVENPAHNFVRKEEAGLRRHGRRTVA